MTTPTQQLHNQATQNITNYLQKIAQQPQEWLDNLHNLYSDTKPKTIRLDHLYDQEFLNLLETHYHTYQLTALEQEAQEQTQTPPHKNYK